VILNYPPGLTCAGCHNPFGGQTAKATRAGWVHSEQCPPRLCTIGDCQERAHARTYCRLHYQRWAKHGDPTKTLEEARAEAIVHMIEDVEWMVETGEHLEGACKRLGKRPDTLEQALYRAGRKDLYLALKHRMVTTLEHPGHRRKYAA
jgi:hypothetical protein